MRRRRVTRCTDGLWIVVGGDWWEYRTFETWTEAIGYADRRARTVEVELPRATNTAHYNFHPTPLVVDFMGIGATLVTHTGQATILRKEWKPLALALLSHHYQQENHNDPA